LEFVLSGAASLRGSARCMDVIREFFGVKQKMPSWYSGRLWLMRIGLFLLTRPKTKADDWIWIIDHTVKIGCEKCFVILGIRQCDFPETGKSIQHNDLELIELLPVKKSNGNIVYQQLKKAAKKTGVPRAILSDNGSDIKSGVDRYCEKHVLVSPLYDITHKVACLLKKQLDKESRWNEFTRFTTKVKNLLQQTALAHLRPPQQRSKARYMNVSPLIKWAQRVTIIVTHPHQKNTKIKKILGGIIDFEEDLVAWGEMMTMCNEANHYMRTQYLQSNSRRKFKAHLKEKHPEFKTPMGQTMKKELLTFIGQQTSECYYNKEKLPASSEVIESVFGKQKYIDGDQSGNGFTGLVLSIGAIVSTLSDDLIKSAMTHVSTKNVISWYKKHIVESVQAKRKKVFSSLATE